MSTQPCYRHPDRLTGLRCSRCDRPICGECSTPAAVGQLCPDDARQRQRVRHLPGRDVPVVTYALLGVNAGMLLVEVVLSGSGAALLNPSPVALCRLGALNTPAIAESGQLWRLLTPVFLHAGLIHFLLNGWALYLYGPYLEGFIGRLRFLALYLGAGFLGAAASFAFNRTILGIGASGAVFGMLGALLIFCFQRRDRGGDAPFQQLLAILLLNVVLSFQWRNIDNWAHGGGLAAGVVAMWLLDRVPARRSELQAAALAVPFLLGLAVTALGIATYDPAFELAHANCAWV